MKIVKKRNGIICICLVSLDLTLGVFLFSITYKIVTSDTWMRIFLVVRSLAATSEAAAAAGFDEMVSSTQRKYYMLGGKGGVGKTSCAASLAVKFANHGHPTIVVSTDPAHSLSDSFAQVANWVPCWFLS